MVGVVVCLEGMGVGQKVKEQYMMDMISLAEGSRPLISSLCFVFITVGPPVDDQTSNTKTKEGIRSNQFYSGFQVFRRIRVELKDAVAGQLLCFCRKTVWFHSNVHSFLIST